MHVGCNVPGGSDAGIFRSTPPPSAPAAVSSARADVVPPVPYVVPPMRDAFEPTKQAVPYVPPSMMRSLQEKRGAGRRCGAARGGRVVVPTYTGSAHNPRDTTGMPGHACNHLISLVKRRPPMAKRGGGAVGGRRDMRRLHLIRSGGRGGEPRPVRPRGASRSAEHVARAATSKRSGARRSGCGFSSARTQVVAEQRPS